MLIDVGPGETRIAHLEDSRLVELGFERASADAASEGIRRMEGSRVGDIVLGRVRRIQPGMEAAFVDIGEMRNGFLSAKHAAPQRAPVAEEHAERSPPPGIRALVHEGEARIVQIIKDPIGEKGARLSLCVSLPGRSLILLPEQTTRALSRRIIDEADRARLLSVLEEVAAVVGARHGFAIGLIARTAALEAEPAQLTAEAEALAGRWRAIKEMAGRMSPPALLARDLPPMVAVLRDVVDAETEAVVINDASCLAAAREDAVRLCPSLGQRLKLHGGPVPLFEAYGVEAQIEALAKPYACLGLGGWITLETTEALTAIDVNSGRFEASSLEETGFRTNLEAAAEIGRQLRLRGIGGLIIVDFIHMAEPAHIAAVEETLREALAKDRTPAQMTPMSPFGVVEITRKRVREPLSRLLQEHCPSCQGHGLTPSIATLANEALRGVCAAAGAGCPVEGLRLRASPDIAGWLLAREETVLAPLRARLARTIDVVADPALARARYAIETQAPVR